MTICSVCSTPICYNGGNVGKKEGETIIASKDNHVQMEYPKSLEYPSRAVKISKYATKDIDQRCKIWIPKKLLRDPYGGPIGLTYEIYA